MYPIFLKFSCIYQTQRTDSPDTWPLQRIYQDIRGRIPQIPGLCRGYIRILEDGFPRYRPLQRIYQDIRGRIPQISASVEDISGYQRTESPDTGLCRGYTRILEDGFPRLRLLQRIYQDIRGRIPQRPASVDDIPGYQRTDSPDTGLCRGLSGYLRTDSPDVGLCRGYIRILEDGFPRCRHLQRIYQDIIELIPQMPASVEDIPGYQRTDSPDICLCRGYIRILEDGFPRYRPLQRIYQDIRGRIPQILASVEDISRYQRMDFPDTGLCREYTRILEDRFQRYWPLQRIYQDIRGRIPQIPASVEDIPGYQRTDSTDTGLCRGYIGILEDGIPRYRPLQRIYQDIRGRILQILASVEDIPGYQRTDSQRPASVQDIPGYQRTDSPETGLCRGYTRILEDGFSRYWPLQRIYQDIRGRIPRDRPLYRIYQDIRGRIPPDTGLCRGYTRILEDEFPSYRPLSPIRKDI